MSAKHRRPFYVFAAVAVICSMVLITGGWRSRAEDSRGPRFHAGSVTIPGASITPLPGTTGSTTHETVAGTDGDTSSGSPDAPDAGGGGDLEAPGGRTADGSTDSGPGVVGLLPELPAGPEVDGPPDTDELPESDELPETDEVSATPEDHGKSNGARARAGHGKNDKDGEGDGGDQPRDKGDKGDQGDKDDQDESDEDEVPVDGMPSQSGDPVEAPDGDE